MSIHYVPKKIYIFEALCTGSCMPGMIFFIFFFFYQKWKKISINKQMKVQRKEEISFRQHVLIEPMLKQNDFYLLRAVTMLGLLLGIMGHQ